MPGRISWLLKDKVVVLEYIGVVTLDDLRNISRLGTAMLNEFEDALGHVIVDESQLTSYPMNVPQGIKLLNATLSHPRLGWLIFVAIPNEVVSFVTKMVLSAARTRYRVVNTFAEAKAALMEADSTLPDLHKIDFPGDAILLYEVDGDQVIDHLSHA